MLHCNMPDAVEPRSRNRVMSIELEPDPSHPLPPGVRLRILGRGDVELLVDHVMALDPEGRRDRFNSATTPEWVSDYARRSIHPGTLVIAAEIEGRVIGVAELHPLRHDTAELAFSVLKEWRGKGIGETLFALIVEAAWSRGLDAIEITTHPDNQRMKHLARKFGAELKFDHGDTVGRLALDEIRMLDSDGAPRPWAPNAPRRVAARRNARFS